MRRWTHNQACLYRTTANHIFAVVLVESIWRCLLAEFIGINPAMFELLMTCVFIHNVVLTYIAWHFACVYMLQLSLV